MKVFGTIEVIAQEIDLYTSREWVCGDGCCSSIEYDCNHYDFGTVIQLTEEHILRDGTFPEFSPTQVIMTANNGARVVYSHDDIGEVYKVQLVKEDVSD